LGRRDRCNDEPHAAYRADRGRSLARHDTDRVEVFWGPMAYAIIGGLFVATLLTLLFLPALYVAWFRIKEPATERRVGVTEPMPATAR
jgi:hypothetical protein